MCICRFDLYTDLNLNQCDDENVSMRYRNSDDGYDDDYDNGCCNYHIYYFQLNWSFPIDDDNHSIHPLKKKDYYSFNLSFFFQIFKLTLAIVKFLSFICWDLVL